MWPLNCNINFLVGMYDCILNRVKSLKSEDSNIEHSMSFTCTYARRPFLFLWFQNARTRLIISSHVCPNYSPVRTNSYFHSIGHNLKSILYGDSLENAYISDYITQTTPFKFNNWQHWQEYVFSSHLNLTPYLVMSYLCLGNDEIHSDETIIASNLIINQLKFKVDTKFHSFLWLNSLHLRKFTELSTN